MDAELTLMLIGLVGGIIFLGFIGRLIFEKTRIPEVVWLMVLGVLIGYSGVVPGDALLVMAPIFGAIALVIILFEGGLNMDFYKVIREFPRSSTLAILNLIFSIIFITIASFIVFNYILGIQWSLLYGVLLGAIVGGSSSAIVIPIVQGLKIRKKIITFLSIESAVTDALCVVSVIAILGFATYGSTDVRLFAHNILSSFSIGAVVGIACGVAWLYVSRAIKKIADTHRLDLAAVLLIYVVVESVMGSGAISVLFFGIVLGNGDAIAKIIKTRKKLEISAEKIAFQREVTFFIRTFFFVFLGMLVGIDDIKLLVVGVVFGVVLLLARIIPMRLSSMNTDITPDERNFILTMAPRGLAAAVLAQLPLVYGIPGAEIFSGLVFVIILTSIFITIVGILISNKAENENAKKTDTCKDKNEN